MNRIERNYDYYNALKEASRQKTKTNSPETYNATEQERQDQTGEQNVLVRSGATVLDLATAIGTGMFKFGEGIVDSLVYLGGAVGGVFDENVRKDAENFIAKDYTGETFAPVQKQLNEWGSYLDDNPVGQTIEQVGQGVGQILPNVLLSVATGGASNALTMGTLGVSAAGNSVEEAFNDGADYGKAGLYGAARGLTEVATEKMFGGATKNIYGKGALDKVVGKATGGALNKGLGKVARNFAEEGIEEAVSELANPLAKSIYKGKDALAEYGTEDYWKGVGEQGLVGGLTGVVAGGTIGKINAKQTEIGENLQEIRKLENTAERMDANDTLSEEYDRRITNRIRDDYKQIESTLKSVNEEKRAKLIKQFNLSDVFDSDGGLNAEYTAERGLNVYDGQAVGDEGNGGVKSLASGSKYVSRRIRYSSQVTRDIEGLNESAKLKGIENPNVRVFDGELSQKGSANYTDTKSLVAKINRKTNNGINLVVIDSDAENIRGVTKGNTIYISKDALESGEGLRKTVHELVHVAQKGKTRQYKDLFNLLAEDEETTAKVIDSLTREGNGYGFTYETFEKITEKWNTSERLTDIENEMLDEIGAWMGEAVLSDERIINRLVRDDTTFASNLINRIQDVSETLRSLRSPAAVKEYRRLKKTEAMYMQAIEAAGYKWSRGKIVGAKEDDKLDGKLANDTAYGVEDSKDASNYSYESLTKKSDLSVVTFPTELPMTEKGNVDTNAVVALGRLNARKQKNPNNTDERTYVYVDDIGVDVLLSKNGMKHGVARSPETAFAVMKIGDVLKNSVAVNELNGSTTRKTEMSYVLLGACRDSENLYVVRSVVSKLKNDVTEIDVYQLGAVKGKKTETPTSALGGTGVKEQGALMSSESLSISVADFLEYVKTIPLANEIFSEDVAKRLGVLRSKGSLSENLRFSLYGRGNGYDGRSMSKNARLAYVNGEQPLSKWNKASIIDAIAEINSDIDVSKLNLDILKKLFLKRAGWHHTSAQYNVTDFYTVDEEYVKGVTQEAVDKIAERQEKKSTTKRDKSLDDVIDEAYFKVQTIVKAGLLSTESGAVRRLLTGKGFDEAYRKAIETIKKNDSNRVDAWRKLPADHYRQEYVKLYDSDIIEYIKKSYANRTLSRNSTMFKQMREYFTKKSTNQSSTPDIRFSLKDSVEQDVLAKYGKTYRWTETGYILKDGTRLDLSGRNEGASGGYRTLDHRDIFDIYEDAEDYGTDAMNQFMARGNIRVMPESPGINLQVEPTEEQYRQIQDLVERLGWEEKYFSVDFDDANGDTIDNITYEGAVSARKVVSDIKYFFKEGSVPHQSELSKFRYSLKEDSNGKKLSEGQKEFFKNSKILDENGNLLLMYHGSKTDVNEFSKEFISGWNMFGKGYYFTSSKRRAQGYAKGSIKETYLNITNPFFANKRDYLDKIYPQINNTREEIEEYSKEHEIGGREFFKVCNYLDDIGVDVSKILKNLGYDGIYYEGYEDIEVVAYESSQIKLTTNKNPTEDADIRFAIGTFPEQVENVINGKDTKSTHLRVLENTPKIFLDVGLSDLPMTITSTHTKTAVGIIVKNKNIHNLSVTTLKQLPKLLERPAMIMESTKRGSIVVFVNAVDVDKSPVLCSILLDGKGYYNNIRIDTNLITSVYGKDANPIGFIERAVDEGRILYWDKKISQELFAVPGLQLPDKLKSLDSNTIIRQINKKSTPNDKKIEKISGSGDTRFSMDGRKAKFVANNTRMKVYSKAESEKIINDILGNSLAFGDKYGDLSGKSKAEAADMLWKGLNSAKPGYRAEVALDVAEYIIQNSVIENIHDVAGNEKYMNDIAVLKPYLHQINLDGIREEIKHRYNGDNSPFMLWGKRKGESGLGADVIARELEELGFRIDAENEADIFFKIDETYREAVERMKKEASIMVKSALTEEELEQLKQEISKQVLLAYDENGQPSKLSKILDGYIKRTEQWKDKYISATEVNRLLDLVDKIKNIKLGTFVNASEYKSDIFKNSIEKLANIKYRGELNKSGTRNIIKGLREWYVKENPLLENSYDEVIAEMLDSIANGKGKLDSVDIQALTKIVDYFTHFVKNFNKVYRNNKYVEALPIAEKYADNIEFVAKYRKPTGSIKLLFNKIADGILDPISVAKRADGYTKGFWTDTLDELQEGAITESRILLELNEPLEKFFKANKSYYKRLEKETVKYKGVDMPVGKAISLCATYRRAQARPALEESGFVIRDKTNDIVFEPSTPAEIDGLFRSLSETDRQFLELVQDTMEKCKNFKRNTDMQRKGYSNVLDDYYYPIRRAFVAVNIDTLSFSDLNSIMNFSFNKDTVKGAKGALCIDSVQNVLRRHISGIAKYCAYAMAIDNYDRLMNLNLGNNPNMPRSILSLSAQKGWRKGTDYFKKLLEDLKGKKNTDSVNKAMGFIRGSYAKFQLGANPKVWLTQGTSYVAAFSKLKLSSLVKGFGISGKDVDSYCELARIRNSDNTAARAQGVLDSVGKVGDFLMKPIGKADRLIIQRLFAACQAEASSMGYALGTEENKVKAGEILKEVILGTQQNAIATERSAMMRHDSEFARAATMFSADAMKVFSRFVDGIGEVSTLHRRLSEMRKEGISQDEISKVEEQLKQAKRKCAKATSTLVGQASVMTLIAMLFKKLYNKDDDDDNFIVETVGNMAGGIPLLRDVYSFFADGYEVNNFFYDTVNSVLVNTGKVVNIAGDLANGREVSQQEFASAMKGMSYAVGQLFGLPVRNIYNVTYGLTNRFDESTAYKWDNVFRKKSFASDIGKAIEEDNLELASAIMSLWMNESGIGDNEKVSSELTNLYSEGFSVKPRNIGDSITYEGETYDLSATDKANFRKIYSQATDIADKLISNKLYEKADSEVRAKAIKYIYDLYYNLGVGSVLNVDMQKKSVLFGMAIPQEILAMVVAQASVLSADEEGTLKAKLQAYISSLNVSAAQKYMLMGYLGYKNKNGEAQVKSYINRLSLTKEQKESLFKMSGYDD